MISGQDPGQRLRFIPLLPVRSCFRTGTLMTSWRIRWSLMVRDKLLDMGVKRAVLLEKRNPLGGWGLDPCLPKLTLHFFPCRPDASHSSGLPWLFRCAVPLTGL